MKVTKDTVVEFHYKLSDEQGELIESSFESEPVAILQGYKNMIEGVENALEGKGLGDKFSVTVAPEQAYGERQEEALQRVPVKHLQGAKRWQPGMVATVHTEQGQRQVTVVKVGKFMITVDINHPLAGKTLNFDIEVLNVRAASEEEISHGHVHGAGGCGH
jgi:FKBP-type peptidyl-prolyl cis-trans isomerase SlyD